MKIIKATITLKDFRLKGNRQKHINNNINYFRTNYTNDAIKANFGI